MGTNLSGGASVGGGGISNIGLKHVTHCLNHVTHALIHKLLHLFGVFVKVVVCLLIKHNTLQIVINVMFTLKTIVT